jgi:transposase
MGTGRADDSAGSVLWTGCQWKALPKDLPPKRTADYYFMLWDWDGTLERIHHALYVAARKQAGREASPTASIIDSQSGKAAQKRGSALDPQGFDTSKKVMGRKRHILVDTLGLLLSVAVHPANIQDCDGVALVLSQRTRRLFPFIERNFADGGYQKPKATAAAARTGSWKIEIVKRPDTAIGFEVVPKR